MDEGSAVAVVVATVFNDHLFSVCRTVSLRAVVALGGIAGGAAPGGDKGWWETVEAAAMAIDNIIKRGLLKH